MTDDSELLCRYARERSEAAFAELVARHVDLVYSSAFRQCRGDHHRAQEVTQMVFTYMARKAAALARHPVLPAWLHRSSLLASLDLHRREARRRKYELAAGTESAVTAPGEGTVEWEKIGPVLDEAINHLDERDRQAILLRYFGNRPYGDIGSRLNLSENAARMRVERALGKLHALLARQGISSSSAALAVALTGHAVAAAPAGVAAASTSAGLAVAGTAGFWIAIMSSSKFPIALTAAVLAGGAAVVAVQDRAASVAALERVDLSRQNQAISGLGAQNRALLFAANQAREFKDDEANIAVLESGVSELESKLDDRRAYAAARLKAERLANSAASNPDSANAKFIQPPKVLNQFRPIYPADMLNSGTSGEVMVDLIVDKNGVVQNAFALSSTDKGFEDAAVQAVSQWTFQPGQANGHSVFTHLQIPVVFTPSADPPAPIVATWF